MKKKERESGQIFGVIGLGRFGSALASTLAEEGKDVLALDRDENKIRQATEYASEAMVVHSLDKKTLEECGVQNCDTVIVCIGSEIDTSILTTLNVISLGIPRVISKAVSYEQGLVLEKIGAEVVYPEHDRAVRLAHQLVSSRILEYISLSDDIDISELKLTSRVHGKTVLEADLRKKFGVNIIALEHANGGGTTIEISPQTLLEEGDSLVVVGGRDNIHRLELFLSKE